MTFTQPLPESLPPIQAVSRDLIRSAGLLSHQEARFLVDLYYTAQDQRIRSAHQHRTSAESQEPHELMKWAWGSFERVELEVKKALHAYAKSQPEGTWMLSIHGVGPVIAAGMISHLRRNPCPPTVGHWWSFAGLDPKVKWEKGQKRPWNAKLKRLCWLLSSSFVRLRSSPNDFYGKLYEQRKAYEIERNERGGNEAEAARILSERRIQKPEVRAAYEAGRLPDGQIDNRARRWTAKIFLSHLHEVCYALDHEGAPIPKPYALAHLGHTHYIAPPNWVR